MFYFIAGIIAVLVVTGGVYFMKWRRAARDVREIKTLARQARVREKHAHKMEEKARLNALAREEFQNAPTKAERLEIVNNALARWKASRKKKGGK